MDLHSSITVPQFRDEMQHRVVKYPLRSRPVRQAIAFARRQADPDFLRIALDKVEAQDRYQAETDGYSRRRRVCELVSMATIPEMALTIVLVIAGCLIMEAIHAWRSESSPAIASEADLDQLADRLGFSNEFSTNHRSAPLAADGLLGSDKHMHKQRPPLAKQFDDPVIAERIERALKQELDRRMAELEQRFQRPLATAASESGDASRSLAAIELQPSSKTESLTIETPQAAGDRTP